MFWKLVEFLVAENELICDPVLSMTEVNTASSKKKKREFNGTPTHISDGYISANQRLFYTLMSKITMYSRIHLEAIPRSFDC